MCACNVHLYIPGLFGVSTEGNAQHFQGLKLAELELLLSRARRQRHQAHGFEAGMFTLFGIDTSAGLPVAAVTYRHDVGEMPARMCLRADPVNLQLDRDQVLMSGNTQLDVSLDEAQQLAQAFNQLYADDGLRLDVPLSQRWYLITDQEMDIHTTPLTQVVGQDIHPYLPGGSNAMYWHSILNEVQMLFYTSEVNIKRRQRGQAEINSLWFWGEGELPNLPRCRWQHVWSNEVLSQSLAGLSECEFSTLPATAEEWLEQAQTAGEHLIVLDVLMEALEQNDIMRWRTMLETINEVWLSPLLAALKANTVSGLCILTDNADFEINSRQLNHWWKRRRDMRALQSMQ